MSTIEVKGKKISYQAPPGFEAGDRKGHTVLLIHGATDNHKIWYQQYEALSQDHTPVAVDLPGHFESEGPGIDNAQAYREFIEDFAQATKLAPFVFCGHSMGGSMALDFAVHHPDLLQAAIMVGSSPSWDLSGEEIEQWGKDPDKVRREESDYMYSKQTPAHIKEWLNREMAGTPGQACLGDLLACSTFDPSPSFEDITTPVLVVVGDEDEMSIPGSRLVAAKVPKARFEMVSPSGPPIMIEQPERLNSILVDFLKGLS